MAGGVTNSEALGERFRPIPEARQIRLLGPFTDPDQQATTALLGLDTKVVKSIEILDGEMVIDVVGDETMVHELAKAAWDLLEACGQSNPERQTHISFPTSMQLGEA